MAKIGLNNFRYSVASVDASTGAITYGTPKKPAKAISFNFTPTVADAKLYADDGVAESDSRVTGGTVSMGIDREDLETLANILGQTYASNEVADDSNKSAPYVGVGRVTRMVVDGTQKYRGTVLSLVKFKEPTEEDSTMGESIEFNTTTLEGDMVIPVNGIWRHRKVFESQSDAVAYIESHLGGASV